MGEEYPGKPGGFSLNREPISIRIYSSLQVVENSLSIMERLIVL